MIAAIGLLEPSGPAFTEVVLKLGEKANVRSGKTVDRLPIVPDCEHFARWPLLSESLDKVGLRFGDILKLVDQDQRVGALILAGLDQRDSVGDH